MEAHVQAQLRHFVAAKGPLDAILSEFIKLQFRLKAPYHRFVRVLPGQMSLHAESVLPYMIETQKSGAGGPVCGAAETSPDAYDLHYSNTGFGLLARIIERVSGMAYDQFITQNLLEPNGLPATTLPKLGSDQGLPSSYVSGYLCNGSRMVDVTTANMSVAIGAGNIISTPADLARWNRRFIRGEAGPDASSVQAMKPRSLKAATAMGWVSSTRREKATVMVAFSGAMCPICSTTRQRISGQSYTATCSTTAIATPKWLP